jgi:glutamyl-tRNA synthetase
MDRSPSYQLTSLIDDLDYRVSHVIRGHDLLESSAFQSLLFTHLPPIAPLPKWMHHELIFFQDHKISKSNGDISIRYLRSQGETAQRIYSWVGNMLGYRSIRSLDNLTSELDLTQNPSIGFNYWV